MKKYAIVFLILITISSCKKEFSSFNVLDNNDELFKIEVSYQTYNVLYKNVTVNFTPLVYDKLTDEQKSKILGYIVFKNGVELFKFGMDRTSFYESMQNSGETNCYRIAYYTDSDISKYSELCVDIP